MSGAIQGRLFSSSIKDEELGRVKCLQRWCLQGKDPFNTYSNGERLNRIVGDLLNLSNIEQGADNNGLAVQAAQIRRALQIGLLGPH